MKKLLSYLVVIFLVFASTLNAADVTLAWDANSEPEVIGYRLHYSTVNEIPFSDAINVEKVTHYTVTGLEENKSYYFAVTAYTLKQESGYSDIVQYIVKPDRVIIRILDRPRNIRVEWGE